MDSGGVYMSADKDGAKKFDEGILKFNEQILAVVGQWQTIVQSDDATQFATFKMRIEQFVEFRKELVRRAVEINRAGAANGATTRPTVRSARR
jgi:methyl-accepting chemotaxis protein